MSEVPIQLIVAAFNDEKGAAGALKELKRAKRAGLVGIKDAAVITRDKKDKLHVKDVKDVGGGKGAVAGGIIGAGIALLTGGVGIVLSGAAGALVGGLTAKTVDMGLPNARLKKLGEALKPETSLIVAIIEHKWVADLEAALKEAGADVMTETLSADIAAQLEAGKNVAYSMTGDESGTSIDRVAGNEESIELSNITMTDEGISASVAVATEDGAAARNLVLTDEGMVVSEVVAVAEDDETGEDSEATGDEEE